MHHLNDSSLGLLPISELHLFKDVKIYRCLDSQGSKDNIGAREAAAGRLVWSFLGLLSDRDGKVIEMVASEIIDKDFGAREGVPLDQLLDAGPHLLAVDVLVQVDSTLGADEEVGMAGAAVDQPAPLAPDDEEVWSDFDELAQKRMHTELLEAVTEDCFVV